MQQLVHYGLHFIFPAFIAWMYDKRRWKKNYLLLLATMLIDLDHLLARPVFEACRCSIQFHPLHTYYAAAVYVALLFPQRSRVIAIGLLFHLLTDAIDCYWSRFNC